MNIDNYISELLFENDIVNVPGLGSFTAQKVSAQIDQAKNQFTPPTKKVAFEPKVKENDDILIKYVAKKEKISDLDASKKLKEFVKTCKEAVIDGKVVVLNKLGKLSMDEEGNYIFEQDVNTNFDKSAIGMKPFSAQSYKQQGTEKIIKQESKKQAKNKKAKEEGKKKRKTTPIIIWSSIAAILIAAGVFAYLNQDLTKKYFYKAKVMVMGEKELVVPNSPKGALDHTYINMVLNDTSIKDALFTRPFIDSTFVTKKFAYQGQPLYAQTPFFTLHPPKIDVTKEPEGGDIVDNTSGQTSSDLSSKHFHVIAGSFENYSNAEKFSTSLKKKGYPNSRVFKKPYNGLHRVTYDSFLTKGEALSELKRYRNQINPDSWVLIQ